MTAARAGGMLPGRVFRLSVSCAIFCLAGAGAVAAAAPVPESACANFAQVDSGLYRGAEPDDRCLEHLSGLGVRTVLNLRDEKDASEEEMSRTTALGMRYLNMPMSGFNPPSVADVQRILAVVRASEYRPVFVHCRRGRDRTGVVVAAYRIADGGWEAEKAIGEASRFGLSWWQFGMKRFIRDLAAESRPRAPATPGNGR